MDINIDAIKLAQEVFGIDGYLLLPSQEDDNSFGEGDGIDKVSIDYPGEIKTVNEDDIVEHSALGTPIFDVVEFKENGNTILRLTDVPIITVTRAKNIVRTQMEGRDGTVKEIISNDDFKINIRGILSNDSERKKPWDKIQSMNGTFTKNVTYQVTSKLLTKLGITDAVFTDIDFTGAEGFENLQPYSINLLSDDPIELQL